MRILQVITDTARRGGQVFGLDLHAALAARGHEVTTVALAGSEDPRPLDVPVLGRRRLGAATLRSLRRRMDHADVTVAHGSTALPACAAAGLGRSTPFVYRNIGDPLYWANTPARRARVRLLLSRAARVAALWPGSARVLHERLRVPEAKLALIPNGVPLERCPEPSAAARGRSRERFGIAGDRALAVYVGALSAEKDIPSAIAAVARLPHMDLLVVGDGAERERLAALADRLAPGRVVFAGSIDSPADALAGADVVVLPSRSEGMPGVLIEAGMMGLPAVATAVGAVSEVVLDGVTGATVAPGDEAAIAAALAAALVHGRAWGQAARRHCLATFEIRQVAGAWEALLDDAFADRVRPKGHEHRT